jgi:hypothetical protein
MNKAITLLVSLFFAQYIQATIHHIGNGYPYTKVEDAAPFAVPGDTIMLHDGIHPAQGTIQNLHGQPGAWIYIMGAPQETAIIEGGIEGIKFSEASYLHISRLTIRSSGWQNIVNIDDAGTYATPTHHIIIDGCVFKDILGQGNHDILKLTGVDDFEVRNCRFINGSYGDGAGIDMNGCHNGIIEDNYFQNPGRFAMQMKGGCKDIEVRRNHFNGGCERTIHIGGSHPISHYRPLGVPYEASDIWVYSNLFIGGLSPIAYVGAVNSHVVNNTFINPEKWIMRILQENTDSSLLPCGNNSFINNIVFTGPLYQNGKLNISSNTAPQTFTFRSNMWYMHTDPSWAGPPNLPTININGVSGLDPLFADKAIGDYSLLPSSPAIAFGQAIAQISQDFYAQSFMSVPSVGAIESGVFTSVKERDNKRSGIEIYPMPCDETSRIYFNKELEGEKRLKVMDVTGRELKTIKINIEPYPIKALELGSGIYLIEIICLNKKRETTKIYIQ